MLHALPSGKTAQPEPQIFDCEPQRAEKVVEEEKRSRQRKELALFRGWGDHSAQTIVKDKQNRIALDPATDPSFSDKKQPSQNPRTVQWIR